MTTPFVKVLSGVCVNKLHNSVCHQIKSFVYENIFRCTKMDCFIDKLPDDHLLTIFEYLDANTLKRATLVCKKSQQKPIC